jgi:GTP-binding protein Era
MILTSRRRTFSIIERYRNQRPVDSTSRDKKKLINNLFNENNHSFNFINYTRQPVPLFAQAGWSGSVSDEPVNPRCLRIGLIGLANSGKSSLFNSIINKSVSAVSSRINTTTDLLYGMKTINNY